MSQITSFFVFLPVSSTNWHGSAVTDGLTWTISIFSQVIALHILNRILKPLSIYTPDHTDTGTSCGSFITHTRVVKTQITSCQSCISLFTFQLLQTKDPALCSTLGELSSLSSWLKWPVKGLKGLLCKCLPVLPGRSCQAGSFEEPEIAQLAELERRKGKGNNEEVFTSPTAAFKLNSFTEFFCQEVEMGARLWPTMERFC